MKVQLNLQNRINFKSSICVNDDDGVFGFDDVISQSKRDFLRDDIFQHNMPDYQYYKQGRLSDFGLKQLLNKFSQKSDIDNKKLVGLNALPNCKQIEKDSFRGPALVNSPEILKELKVAGVRRVIDLTYGSHDYRKACVEAGLEYLSFPIVDNIEVNPALSSEVEYLGAIRDVFVNSRSEIPMAQRLEECRKKFREGARPLIDETIKLIQTLNRGKYYIGCTLGTDRTDVALLLNRYFNPKDKTKTYMPQLGSSILQEDAMRNFYEKLTDADKKALGFTPKFEKNLIKKLAKTCKFGIRGLN